MIKAERIAREWSQGELGRRARPKNPISHTTISGIENGHTDPQISTLEAIATALGLGLADLLVPDAAVHLSLRKKLRDQLIAQLAHELHGNFEQLTSDVIDRWTQLLAENFPR